MRFRSSVLAEKMKSQRRLDCVSRLWLLVCSRGANVSRPIDRCCWLPLKSLGSTADCVPDDKHDHSADYGDEDAADVESCDALSNV